MLETRVLLLRRDTAKQPRLLTDAATGKPVGFARWQVDSERPWLGSLLGPVLAIHEQEEEPLLFTVRRCLLWTQREVHDAEGERVGYFSTQSIRDRNRLLYARAKVMGQSVAYECVNGMVLATTRHTMGGLELAFAAVVEPDPFAKMLLLAAALFEQ